MSELLAAWRERVRAAAAEKTPLRIVGGGSKDFYGQQLAGDVFEVGGFAGIVDYDPTELVITARCGTPLADIERAMAESGQMLAFEPPHFGPNATLGGCIAAGLSGPRRAYAGAVRDVVLGVRLLDGQGDALAFGGRVMKNVAGFDVSRLIAGSLGTLGVVLEVSLKCLPLPRAEATRRFELPADEALRKLNEWSAAPLPLSASCWHDRWLHLRLSGAESAVAAAARRLGGETLDDAAAYWAAVRDQTHPFFAPFRAAAPAQGAVQPAPALWRLSVRSTAPPAPIGEATMIEWGGALRWIVAPGDDAPQTRAWAAAHGGHATLFRAADKSVGAFHPLPPAMLALHRRLKAALDPAGIFNPGRMYAEL
ncbi:MAG: glycolate oxidase subunit GlcE [Casimicrobiaceae bacterium]